MNKKANIQQKAMEAVVAVSQRAINELADEKLTEANRIVYNRLLGAQNMALAFGGKVVIIDEKTEDGCTRVKEVMCFPPSYTSLNDLRRDDDVSDVEEALGDLESALDKLRMVGLFQRAENELEKMIEEIKENVNDWYEKEEAL